MSLCPRKQRGDAGDMRVTCDENFNRLGLCISINCFQNPTAKGVQNPFYIRCCSLLFHHRPHLHRPPSLLPTTTMNAFRSCDALEKVSRPRRVYSTPWLTATPTRRLFDRLRRRPSDARRETTTSRTRARRYQRRCRHAGHRSPLTTPPRVRANGDVGVSLFRA